MSSTGGHLIPHLLVSDINKSERDKIYIWAKCKRITASAALHHIWLQDAGEITLNKSKLKRYVIKKRWIKAVNTIIALQRMGARIETDEDED